MNQANSYIMRCTSCGTRNRIPAEKVGQTATCGRCRDSIDTSVLNMAHPLVVTDSSFQDQVIRSPLPVLLDCWAPWCGPCHMMGPVMDQLAAEWKGKIRVCKMNVDENPGTSAQYQIRSIPTLLIFDRGLLQDSLAGALPKHSIIQAMKAYL